MTPSVGSVHTAPDHDVRAAWLRESVRNGLWVIPGAFVTGAIVAALVLRIVDEEIDTSAATWLFAGDASSAQSLLGVIATSVMTLTSLVLSVTVVALQLASQQFSPRVLRTFFRDTGTKVSLGIFLGTIVFALMVLREVHPSTAGGGEAVPRLSITVAFVLVLVSLGAFVYYVNHVVHAIRIVAIIDSVAAETRAAIREVHVSGPPSAPLEVPDRPPDHVLLAERSPGTVVTVDEDDLVALAARHGCLLRIVPRMGEFVPSRAPLAEVWALAERGASGADEITARAVLARIGLHRERTMHQDVAFGFRQLVDIAEKALSPAINDPTTAVQALDRIHDLLRRVATSPAPSGYQRDEAGVLRLIRPVPSWADLVGLGCDEIRQYGGASVQVQRRMRAMLDDLAGVVGAEQRVPLERQIRMLDATADRHFPDADDRDQVGRRGTV